MEIRCPLDQNHAVYCTCKWVMQRLIEYWRLNSVHFFKYIHVWILSPEWKHQCSKGKGEGGDKKRKGWWREGEGRGEVRERGEGEKEREREKGDREVTPWLYYKPKPKTQCPIWHRFKTGHGFLYCSWHAPLPREPEHLLLWFLWFWIPPSQWETHTATSGSPTEKKQREGRQKIPSDLAAV